MRRDNSSPHGLKGKIVISFISFIIGLQARNVLDLFSSTYNYEISSQSSGNYNNGAWAPQVSELNWRNANAARKSRTSRYAERNGLDAETDAPTMAPKPKRQKEIPRFNRDNYTETSEPLLWSLPTRGHSDLPSADEFMKSYIAEKRRLGKDIPWEKPLGDERAVKLPLPIIGLNFPKSATLTLKEFFKCGGLTAIHTSTQQGRIAICMRENLLAGNAPLHGCNYHKSKKTRKIEPIDFISDIGTQFPCFYSSLHDGGLEAIAEHYPHATIMLVTRNAKSWHRSMSKWGSILKHWQNRCGFDGNLNHTKSDYWHQRWINSSRKKEDYWIDFYNAHTQKIRDFAMKNPSVTYVEVELEDENMANKMEYYTGVPSTCVMDCHPGPNWIREHSNLTGRCLPVGGISQSAKVRDNSRGRDWTDDDDETGEQR